ncbi:MAG: rhamnogalacturonan acetylesterase [Acidobacteriota bacterium]|nr:rhamnogalacturonan acetylesterase [Acidobacteriota bacterium]
MTRRSLLPALLLLLPAAAVAAQTVTLTCGANLTATTLYSPATAGFDLGTTATVARHSCSSDRPFFVSFPVPEGSYRVTVTLGGPHAATTTVRAEARRLMLEKIATRRGESRSFVLDVNERRPEIAGTANRVHLKPREIGNLDWDDKLTLEFNGDQPTLRSVSVEPVPPHTPTVYLAGDSTVVDQDIEPWTAWGQMLPRFFLPGVVVANHAESGETIKSFFAEQRFAKLLPLLQTGDYLLLQFNHNDQKVNPTTGVPAVTLQEYRRMVLQVVASVRAAGATPVLVTSMNRRVFDAQGHITNTLGEYPDTLRSIAADEHVALIDLNAMSKTLFETLGPEATLHAFMHYPANSFPNQPSAIADDTHFNGYGAYELARCVVHGIRAAGLPLASHLDPAVPDFDPAHPDPLATFSLPVTPIPAQTETMKLPQT